MCGPIEIQHYGHWVASHPPRLPRSLTSLGKSGPSASESERLWRLSIEAGRWRAGWARRAAERRGRCGCRAVTAMPPSSLRTCPAAWPAPRRSTTASRVRPGRAVGAGAGSSRAPASPGLRKALQTVDCATAEHQGQQRNRRFLIPPLSRIGNMSSDSDSISFVLFFSFSCYGAEVAYRRCLVAHVLIS